MHSGSFNPNGSFRNSSFMSATQPQASPDHFHFKERRGRVDWRLIAPIDVNRLMRDGDIDVLQSLVETLTFADLESEAQHRYSDPEFVKIMRICQLAIEYLLHVQDVLDVERKQLREQAQSYNDDMLELNNQLTKSKEEANMLKRDVHTKKKMISNLEMMLKLPVSSARLPDGRIFRCPLCSKIFATCQYLENHVYRRHPDQANLPLVQTALANYQNETVWQNQADFTKRERDDETQAELKQLRELKEKLTKETERLTQTEREMRDKLEEQLNQERINLRKKEDEMEKTQMDQRLRYEEELRNFQSSMRKELFDHKLQIADQQRKTEEVKEPKPKTGVGVLESDDEGMNRKTLVESQIKDAVAQVKQDFEKQLSVMKEKAAKEQEQSHLLIEEERKRAAQEKRRAVELAQQEMEREREKARLERERTEEQAKSKRQQEVEAEKAQNEMKLKKQMQKQQQLLQQKEQQLKLSQQQQQQQKMEHLRKQQLLQQQQHEEEEERRRLAQQRRKRPDPKREIEEEPEPEPEEEDELLINLQIPQVAKFAPFPNRPYLKSLFDHSEGEIEAEHAEIVAQVVEELEVLGVPATGMKKKELEQQLAQLEADKVREEEILQDFPLELQQQMQEELRHTVEDIAGQYYVAKEEEEEEDLEPKRSRTPSMSRRSSTADLSPNARRPPPSPSLVPANMQRKLSQQLAQEAISKKGNLRASTGTDLRSSVDSNARLSLKNPSSAGILPPNKKSRTQQQRGMGGVEDEDEEMNGHDGDEYYDDERDEQMYEDDDELQYMQQQRPNQRQSLKQQQQLQKPKAQTNIGRQQLQPRQLRMMNGSEFDDDDDEEGRDDLVVSNSNVSDRSRRTNSDLQAQQYQQNVPKNNNNTNNKKNKNESNGDGGNPGFRSSTELASFEVSDDEVDESLSSLHHLAKKNQPPKQQTQQAQQLQKIQQQHKQQQQQQQLQQLQQQQKPQPLPAYNKDEDFDDDDDLDDDIYASAPPPASKLNTKPTRTDDDDLNDFLAETEDVLGGSKYSKSVHREVDDAVEKSYDDVGWDEVMEM